jgi:hypothetical protein
MTHVQPTPPSPHDGDVELEPDDDSDDDLDTAVDQAEALDLTADERKLVTQPYDLGVKSISTDIEQGRISLTIEYQRKYVWDLGKASRLIESLLLNVPIPVCYFAEDEDGVYEVIDGLQRLTTIKRYLDGEFSLTGISVLSELEGKRFNDLAPRDQRRLENRTIRCIVITEDSHPDIKFDVFERLNTGAASLTAQELRNSVFRGLFNDTLKNLAEEPYFRNLTGTFNNKRMDLEELILRFFALVDGLSSYKPPLRQFLNLHMRTNRRNLPTTDSVALFRESCVVVDEVLGNLPFKVAGSKNPLNKAMFDAIMIPVAFADKNDLREHADAVRRMVESLHLDDDFKTSIGRATADRFRMLYRVGLVAQGLRDAGVSVDLPEGLGLDGVTPR